MEYKSAIADIQHATSKMKKGKIGCERKRNGIARRLSNINIILCGWSSSSIVDRRRSGLFFFIFLFHLRSVHTTQIFIIRWRCFNVAICNLIVYVCVCARDTRWLMTSPFLYSFHILHLMCSIWIAVRSSGGMWIWESEIVILLWQCFRTFVDCVCVCMQCIKNTQFNLWSKQAIQSYMICIACTTPSPLFLLGSRCSIRGPVSISYRIAMKRYEKL